MLDYNEVEKIEKDGVVGKLYHDQDAMSPDEWDNLGTLFLENSRYTFGNRVEAETLAEAIEYEREQGHILVPVYLYDYGSNGATLRASDEEDANGYLVAYPVDIEKLGVEIDDVERQLKGEIEEWKQYIEGDVYGYSIFTPDGEDEDSLWGLYGRDYAEEELKSAFESVYEDYKERVNARERDRVRTFG